MDSTRTLPPAEQRHPYRLAFWPGGDEETMSREAINLSRVPRRIEYFDIGSTKAVKLWFGDQDPEYTLSLMEIHPPVFKSHYLDIEFNANVNIQDIRNRSLVMSRQVFERILALSEPIIAEEKLTIYIDYLMEKQEEDEDENEEVEEYDHSTSAWQEIEHRLKYTNKNC